MSEIAGATPPRFIRASAVGFIVLLPFLIHAVWGFIEAGRLRRALESIEAKGEPIQIQLSTPEGEAARAERFYRAAAALASEFRPDPRGWHGQITVAERTREWPADLVERIRTLLASYEEMLAFVDRAADLPFEDFAAGTTYNYLAAGLIDAIRLTSLQAVVRGLDGEADQAADSLFAAARAGRWFSRRHPSFVPYSLWFSSAVTLVLERTQPSQRMLERLATALEDPDRDDVVRQTFLTMRAGLLRQGDADPWFIGPRAAPVFVVNRPWRTHQMNSQLAWYVKVLEAAETPWPARIDAIVDTRVENFNLDVPFSPERMRQFMSSLVTPLAVIRSLRTVVAIERYRRSHGGQVPASLTDVAPAFLPSVPIDPFTGQALRYTRAADGYVVYSLGANRTDEGGDIVVPWAGGSDSGIRIRYVDQRRAR